jgi:lantibiotic transport system permease protein
MKWLLHLGNALYAESLKLKKTLALWMCLIAPSVVVGLYVLQTIFGPQPKVLPPPMIAWQEFSLSCFALWSFLMLPLFVTLESALLAGLEHNEKQWKHLLALPLPRSVHYLAKWVALESLVALAMLILLLLIPLGGGLLSALSYAGIAGLPDFGAMLLIALKIFLAASLMIALHCYIAIRWKSFTVAVSIGMSATVMGFLVGQSAKFGPFFPWTMAIQALTKTTYFTLVLGLSCTGALLLTGIASWRFGNREMD